jgi:sugar lactone lactonase YvrE
MKLTTAVRVMKFSVPVAETFAGSGVGNGFSGDGGSAKLAMLSTPVGINFDLTGNLYIADVGNGRIRRITKDGAITTFAGGGISNQDGIPATQATLDNSRYVAVDKSGSIFISSVSGTVRKVDNLGIINTLHPISEIGGAKSGMVFDTQNNLYVRATAICQILKMDTLGNVTKFAGTDCGSNSGDGGQATNARFGGGESLFIDSDNNIYINTEWPERKVRKINSQGIISTVINESSLTGSPGAVAVDKKGRVYVSTFYPYSTENRILRYNANGTITTIINNSGLLGFNGDIVAPLDMLVYNPGPMAFNSDGLLYFTDVGNNRVRRVSVQ